MSTVNRRILPGFHASLGFALLYLTALVLLPLAACFIKTFSLTFSEFWAAVSTERARAAYLLTFGTSFVAATISSVLGLIVAWVLVRYEFPGKRLFDAIIDLPFALPTAVAGLVYVSLYYNRGWFGQFLYPLGIELAYTRAAIVWVLTFLSLPFIVRTVQPVLETFEVEQEEAAASLGANRFQTVTRVVLPALVPALITGFALAFARCLGEYGSVVFVAANMPFKTEIAPVLIVGKLEGATYDDGGTGYAEATALASVLLVISFSMLIVINLLQHWSRRHEN